MVEGTWAVVEMLGHRRVVGQLSEVTVAGAAMLRVEIPTDPPGTVLCSPASLYAITPISEDAARQSHAQPRELTVTRAAMGYHRAGFDVVGVDIVPQPHYPFEFHQADAITFPLDGFDAVHASPPCNDHSQLHKNYGAPEHGTGWLLAAILVRLRAQERPWVVENVVGAHLPAAIELCGATFGLGASGLDLNRHRRFATSFPMMSPPCQHRRGHTIGVYGNGTNKWHRTKLGRNLTTAEQREAMGIDWMNRAELAQAIPPAYTEYIGQHLLAALGVAA